MRKVDDNENSVFKQDQFLMSFQVFSNLTLLPLCFIYLMLSRLPSESDVSSWDFTDLGLVPV